MAATAQVTPRVCTKQEFGRTFHLSPSMVDRIVSNGLVRVIWFGARPLIPLEECDRVAREGLPRVPGYRRMTKGPVNDGRPPKRGPKKKSS